MKTIEEAVNDKIQGSWAQYLEAFPGATYASFLECMQLADLVVNSHYAASCSPNFIDQHKANLLKAGENQRQVIQEATKQLTKS